MGFMDEVSGGGGAKLLKFDGKAGNYVVRGSDTALNNQEFIADIYSAKGGYMKFGGKGVPPERQLGSIFPRDEAPLRSTLGNTDKSEWAPGKFNSDEVEDPWTAVIEIPMTHRETGEPHLLTAQTRGALAAVKDLLAQCRRLPESHNPIIRLAVGSYKSKFGTVKKPVLTIVGKSPIDGGADKGPFDDEIPF
jgi:hypothetical protein